MQVLRTDGDSVTIEVSLDEVRLLMGGLRETLDAVEDWELPIRLGAEISEVRALMDGLRSVESGS